MTSCLEGIKASAKLWRKINFMQHFFLFNSFSPQFFTPPTLIRIRYLIYERSYRNEIMDFIPFYGKSHDMQLGSLPL